MRFSLRLLALLASCLVPHFASAQIPLGAVAATFPYNPSRLLVDPVRPWIYVAEPRSNSVIIIDTDSLTEVATLPATSNPVDLAVSFDHNTLYIANAGSTIAAVDVYDLNSLEYLKSFPLPAPPTSIAPGLGGRIYLTATAYYQNTIYQLDGDSGEVQTTFRAGYFDANKLLISPDGNTLYVGGDGLYSFDVSSETPLALQSNDSSDDTTFLALSHDGNYLCLPCSLGNSVAGMYYSTYLTGVYAATDFTALYGTFDNGPYPGPLTFSPDDTRIYQVVDSTPRLQVFDRQSFTKLGEVPLPNFGTSHYPEDAKKIVADHSGTYLFVVETTYGRDTDGNYRDLGQLFVLGTGVTENSPASATPSVDLVATVPSVTAGIGRHATFKLTRTGGDFSQPLTVSYTVKGTAINGSDYQTLTGKRTIPANRQSVQIPVIPADEAAGPVKTVRLTLKGRPAFYQLGESTQAVVKIRPNQ